MQTRVIFTTHQIYTQAIELYEQLSILQNDILEYSLANPDRYNVDCFTYDISCDYPQNNIIEVYIRELRDRLSNILYPFDEGIDVSDEFEVAVELLEMRFAVPDLDSESFDIIRRESRMLLEQIGAIQYDLWEYKLENYEEYCFSAGGYFSSDETSMACDDFHSYPFEDFYNSYLKFWNLSDRLVNIDNAFFGTSLSEFENALNEIELAIEVLEVELDVILADDEILDLTNEYLMYRLQSTVHFNDRTDIEEIFNIFRIQTDELSAQLSGILTGLFRYTVANPDRYDLNCIFLEHYSESGRFHIDYSLLSDASFSLQLSAG